MPSLSQLLSALREQITENLSRSDVLRPLYWVIFLLIIALFGALHEHAPEWVLITVMCMLVMTCFCTHVGMFSSVIEILMRFVPRDTLSARWRLNIGWSGTTQQV